MLPPSLRRQGMWTLIKCCLQPLVIIYDRYAAYVDLVNQKLTPISYTVALVNYLNSLFYLPAGTIYIEDTIDKEIYLFCDGEMPEATYLFTSYEGVPLYVELSPVPDDFEGFIIKIPESLASDDNIRKIKRWVDYYKIIGVNYKIESYE